MELEGLYNLYKETVEEHSKCPLFSTNPIDKELVEDIKNNKIVIYTAFTGDYDTLKDPDFIDDNCDYVCFTDNPNIKSDIWNIIPMEESNLDNNRKAKQYRIFPHKYFKDYKYSFWIDASFKIRDSVREYVYENISSNMLCMIHNERDCVYDESYISSRFHSRYSTPILNKQIEKYKKEGFPSHYGLVSSGFLFRKHNDSDIIKLMEDWWEEIINYSNQDQVSFSYVCWKNNFHPSVAKVFTWENKYFTKNKGYQHEIELKTPLVSENLIKGIENNNVNRNNLSLEDVNLLIEDIYTLKYELEDKEMFFKLYVDNGKGLVEEDAIHDVYVHKFIDKLYFDLSSYNNLQSFAFIPIEGEICSCSILSINSNGKNPHIFASNSYNSVGDKKQLFLIENPIYYIDGDFENANFLEIEFQLDILNENTFDREFNELTLNNQLFNKNIEIDKMTNLWLENKSSLQRHEIEINELNREINRQNLSLSSKTVKIARKVNKLLGKILSKVFLAMLLRYNIHLNKFLKNYKAYNQIKELNLFDEEYYISHYPNVTESDIKLDPLIHYIFYGSREGLNPSKYFDTSFYLNKYQDVSQIGINPLVHYVLYGINENRLINKFDQGFIKNSSSDIYSQFKEGFYNNLANDLKDMDIVTDTKYTVPYIETVKEDKDYFEDDRIKVGVFLDASKFKDMEACAFIRLFKPLTELAKSKKYQFFFYTHTSLLEMDQNTIINYKCFDKVIIQRIFRFEEAVTRKCKEHGIELIFEMDDDLVNIDINNNGFNHIINFKENLLDVIEKADRITFSTSELSKRYNSKNNITLIKNYHLNDLLPMKHLEKNNENIIKIGYFGTDTHTNDLIMIKNVIQSLKSKLHDNHGIELIFEVVGGFCNYNDPENWYEELDFEQMNFKDFYNYLGTVPNWDIGIAPLENNYFNKAKSELKYIEYTAIGVPVICSDFGPYKKSITDGVNGFLAKNPMEWLNKLERLCLDKNLRENILNNARNDLKENYTLEDRVQKWDKILSSNLN